MDHNFHTTSGTPKAAYVASASPSQFQSSSAPPTWYVDSAATSHITNDLNQLSDYQPYQGTDQVTIGDGSSLPIHHIGNGLLPTPSFPLKLQQVLHVPHISSNLLSVHRLASDNNCSVIFDADKFVVQDKDTKSILYKGLNSQGLYHAPQSVSMFSSSSPQACFKSTNSPTAASSTAASAPNWHLRLGHPSSTKLHHILNTFHLPSHPSSGLCPHCCVSKTHRLPFSLSNSTVNKPLALIHSDVWGPFSASVSGYKYYVVFIDDFSKFTWLFPLHYKSEVFSKFLEFKALVETQFSTSLKILRSDNGGEYLSTEFQNFLKQKGILHHLTCPHTPPQNGVAERKHRHLIETTIALMHHASLPLNLWFEALATAVLLINRLPTAKLHNLTPFEMLFNKPPDYSFLRIFGCRCYPWLRPYTNHKLQPKSIPCVFIGYHPSVKGYRCLDPSTGHIYLSRHVVFDETCFPFASCSSSSSSPVPSVTQLHSFFWPSTSSSVSSFSSPSSVSLSSSAPPIVPLPVPSSATHPISSTALPLSNSHPPVPSSSYPIPISSISIDLPLSAPVSTHNAPHISSNTHSMVTRSKSTSLFPTAHLAQVPTEPSSYKEASQSSAWTQAMNEEFHALQLQHTWSLVDLPPNKNVIGCKWVYRLKKNSDGSIARYKARLVAKGYLQEEGIDYEETFSPVAKQPTIRILLCLALHFGWSIKQLDVSNAFLHGVLHEEVYMTQPSGFIDSSHPHKVCKLHKALYGLKQAPRAWFSTFSTFLLSQGFIASHCDSSLFIKKTASAITILLIYVDDILLTGSDVSYITSLLAQMHKVFSMKELGFLNYFLGISVHMSAAGFFLHQSKYATEILAKAGMSHCKPYASPMATKSSSFHDSDLPFAQPALYRSIVGALQYLTITRPDIAFAVNSACQHMHAPLVSHFNAVKRLLRYLKGTLHKGLQFQPGPLVLTAYSDSDWAGNALDRRSTTGFCIFLGPNLVSWSAKKQPTVSRSSTEAEYRALAQTSAELSWLGMLLRDLHIPFVPPTLWCDNLSAIALSSNPVFHARSKHIEVDYHFVRERVASKQLLIKHLATADQLADILTKPLPVSRFHFLQHKLLAHSSPVSLPGHVKQTQPSPSQLQSSLSTLPKQVHQHDQNNSTSSEVC
ncbi:unnamed protein product [Camellia sinensis]